MERAFPLALVLFAFPTLTLSVGAQAQANDPGPPRIIHRINPHGVGLMAPTGSTAPTTPIVSHGGPVLSEPKNLYLIWYGDWNRSAGSDTLSGQQIVLDFASALGSSPYFDINTSYDGLSSAVSLGGEVVYGYPRGTRLKDSDVQWLVVDAISTGNLPKDATDGMYVVLTSSDVSELSGFCKTYCGWHTAANTSVGHIRYAFVGNPNRCLNACAIQTISPNNNAGVDAMVSVIAHELDEITTDPDLTAWYDSRGAENADKCAWTFGHSQRQLSNGSWANVTLGTHDYMIQRNLYHNLNGPTGVGDYCMMDSIHN